MNVVDPRLAIGGNNPPLALAVREEHKDVFDRLDELAGADALVPEVIANDDEEGKAQDLELQCKKTVAHAKAMHKMAKEPYDTAIKEIKATFTIPMEKVEKAAATINKRVDVYKEKKAAEERRRREAEAQRQREESERLQREAAEAERRQREAAEARRIEEERAARAQADREKAEREAREARERAEAMRQEQIRMEQERKERLAREAIEAKQREEQNAIQQAEQAVRRQAEEEAHAKRMAELKAQREAEEKSAAESRVAAQKALAERREAEEAANVAKRDEKAAAREAGNNIDDAVRMEKRADRLDDAAQASEAVLSRGRGEYGSVGSRVTSWKWRMLNRDDLPLETLRAYLNPDAIDAAVTRFMGAHRPELGRGNDFNKLLPGVEFYQEQTTRVA